MDILINPKSEKPIYEQLYQQISALILNGELAADESLPSIRAFARELGVSIITVKTAYENLERDDYIYTQAGRGCYVLGKKKKDLEDKKHALARQILLHAGRECLKLGLTEDNLTELFKKLFSDKR